MAYTLIPTLLLSAGMLVLFTLANSMLADICDEDELEHGLRREGVFSAVYSWWLKCATAMGFVVTGVLLESTGFDESLQQQSTHTLRALIRWDIALPCCASILAALSLWNYPIDESSALKTRQDLSSKTIHMIRLLLFLIISYSLFGDSPNKVTLIETLRGHKSIDLVWKEMLWHTYEIQRSESLEGPYITLHKSSRMTPRYSDRPPKLGHDYYYRIRALLEKAGQKTKYGPWLTIQTPLQAKSLEAQG